MRLVIFITAIFFSACATRTVTFSVNEKASINLVTPANTDGQGERIGEAPQTIALNRLEGKVVKISGPGLLPQFWVLSKLPDGETKIQIKLERRPDEGGKKNPNLSFRLLMKAYKALADKNYKMASELAIQLARIERDIAAPHIIHALSLIQQGQTKDAKVALEAARSFDPEDAEITKLLQAVK
jgi:hypothetical protein